MAAHLAINSLVGLQVSIQIPDLTVKKFLWGYEDPLVKTANNVLPTWIDFTELGLLDRVNNIINILIKIY